MPRCVGVDTLTSTPAMTYSSFLCLCSCVCIVILDLLLTIIIISYTNVLSTKLFVASVSIIPEEVNVTENREQGTDD